MKGDIGIVICIIALVIVILLATINIYSKSNSINPSLIDIQIINCTEYPLFSYCDINYTKDLVGGELNGVAYIGIDDNGNVVSANIIISKKLPLWSKDMWFNYYHEKCHIEKETAHEKNSIFQEYGCDFEAWKKVNL